MEFQFENLKTDAYDDYCAAECISALSDSHPEKQEIEKVRQHKRSELRFQRKQVKDGELDERRLLDNAQNAVDVAALANKLKNKVDVEDLRIIKNVLLDDENNMKIVLSQEGALRGIVRELTGKDVKRQQEAAGILCNLALGPPAIAQVISKMACVYLTITLESQNEELAVVSAWSLGNLCGTGGAARSALEAAGAPAALCRAARRHNLHQPALYALTLYADTSLEHISAESLEMILEATHSSRCDGAFRLFFTLSCHPQFRDRGRLQAAVDDCLPEMMMKHCRECGPSPQCCSLLFALRVCANLRAAESARLLSHVLSADQGKELFTSLLHDERLRPSMLWLLGNIQNCTEDIEDESEENLWHKQTDQNQDRYKNTQSSQLDNSEAISMES